MKKLSLEEFVDKAKLKHHNKYDYSKVEYINSQTKVCIICPEHGEFWQKPNAHLEGKGCPLCSKTRKLTLEEFIVRAKKVHGDKYDYSKTEYKNLDEKVCIICPEHGEFWQTPHSHLQGEGCPQCSNPKNSKISQKIENILMDNKVEYIREKTFEWLIDKRHLYLDFFLPEYNIGIECHGIQHFKPHKIWGGEQGLKERQYKDSLKWTLCKEHGIKIFYFANIDYKYFDKIYCDENLMMKDIWKQQK